MSTNQNGRPQPSVLPVRRQNLKTLILDRLRELIATEGLRPGDRLPPERQLAKQLNVSRPSLRSALDTLSQNGALRRIQGGGTYLEANFASILAAEQHSNLTDGSTFSEVVEARTHLEPILAQLAAAKATKTQIESLRAEVIEAGKNLEDILAWNQHDLRFHTHLARLSGNNILSKTLESLFPQVLASWQARPERLNLEKLLAEHTAIVDALAEENGVLSAQRMRDHLHTFQQLLTEPQTVA
ncbi:MAG: FadR family transcriptional regulator [Planctomycetales bacterium]